MTEFSESAFAELPRRAGQPAEIGFLGGNPSRRLQQFQLAMQTAGVGDLFKNYRQALEASGVMALSRSLEKMYEGRPFKIGNALRETQASQLALGSALDRFARDMGQFQSIGEALRLGGSLAMDKPMFTGMSRLSEFQAGLAALGLQDEAAQRQALEGITQELLARQKAEENQPRIVELEEAAVIQVAALAEMVVVARPHDAASNPAETIWNKLPTWVLILLFNLLFNLPLAAVDVVANWEDARAGLVDLNARLPQTESFSELRRYIRTELASKAGDFRIVSGWGVALRAEPNMKSEVILRLPYQAVVAVLDKEDRTWRYVSYQHEGYVIDGYVSTKFLKKGRR